MDIHIIVDIIPSVMQEPSLTVNITPNPATAEIQLQNSPVTHHYKIVDFNGTIIKSGILTPEEKVIKTQSLPNGIYVLILEDEKNNVSVGKFVKN